jgi:hypothetical protein
MVTLRLSLLFLATVILAVAQPLTTPPVVVTQMDGYTFPSGGEVAVYAIASMPGRGSPNYEVSYMLDRLKTSGDWERIGESVVKEISSSNNFRTKVFNLQMLSDGTYRLSSFRAGAWLESVRFVVGAPMKVDLSRGPHSEAIILDGFHPLRIVICEKTGCFVYFRRELAAPAVGGYLYQIVEGKTVVFPTCFEQFEPTPANRAVTRGGAFDSAWVRAKLPKMEGLFNFVAPIYGAAVLNGYTIQGLVFDPTNPYEFVGKIPVESVPRPSW